ncbi:MAG: NAD(P)H-binding protein, partial [Pseudonocardiaceae bacterium]
MPLYLAVYGVVDEGRASAVLAAGSAERHSGSMTLRILVTGATGYIGGRLVPELLADGHTVRCLARTPAKLDERPWRHEVEVAQGDAGDPKALAEA